MVTSQRAFKRALREIDYSGDIDPYCEPTWHGCVHAYRTSDGLVCIVGLNIEMLSVLEPINAAAVIVHEAVHVWQHIRGGIGPGELGVEMEAYAVQNISANLMRAFSKAISSASVAAS